MLENNQSMINFGEKLREIVVCFWIMQRLKIEDFEIVEDLCFWCISQIYVAITITSTKCYSFNH